jgi:hypothetical protein
MTTKGNDTMLDSRDRTRKSGITRNISPQQVQKLKDLVVLYENMLTTMEREDSPISPESNLVATATPS